MLICNKCFKIYNKDTAKYSSCECTGRIVEIDDNIVQAIILLNKAGYITEYCCSGHYYNKYPDPYIKFKYNDIEQVNLYKKVFADIPSPWYFDQAAKDRFRYPYNNDEFAKKQICLRCNIDNWDNMDNLSRNNKIKEINNILYTYLKMKFGE